MRQIVLLLLMVFVLCNIAVQSTSAYFVDTEISSGNVLTAWVDDAIPLLNDGFENDPWDDNWDDNGATGWARTSSTVYTGTYAAMCDQDNNGSLVSDDLDTLEATSIAVSFWFKAKKIEAGDMTIQVYNGSTYDTWYDVTDYPAYKNNAWCQFTEVITEEQFFTGDFKLRFDGSGLTDKGDEFYIDDVVITIE